MDRQLIKGDKLELEYCPLFKFKFLRLDKTTKIYHFQKLDEGEKTFTMKEKDVQSALKNWNLIET